MSHLRPTLPQVSEQWVRLCALSLVVVIPIIVSPWDPDGYSRPKALVLYTLTALMVMGWLLSYAATRRLTWRATLAEWPLWIFVLALLVSTWTTADPTSTFLGAYGRREGLPTMLAYTALFLVGVHYFGSQRSFRGLVAVLTVVALAVMAYGVSKVWFPPAFVVEAEMMKFYNTMGFKRLLSTAGSPVTYGGYLSFVIPLYGSLYLAEQNSMMSGVWLSGGVLALVSLVLTMTRGAWIGVLVGGVVFVSGLGLSVMRTHRRRLVGLLVLAVMAVALVTATTLGPELLHRRVSSAFDLQSGSTAQHVYLWKKTIGMIRERPLLGWGLESLWRVFPYERGELVAIFGLRPVIIDRAHNDVLQVAVSTGIPGAVAYVTFWALVIALGLRLVRRSHGEARMLAVGFLAALVGYLGQAQFSFSTVAVTPLVWLLAGSVVGWEAAAGDG